MNEFHRIAPDVELGERVRLSGFLNLYGCRIGDDTTIGSFVEIQRGASIGSRCKISSHTFICDGVTIEDECFIGHAVTFTNDRRPRAVGDDGRVQNQDDWELERTFVRRGASVGSGVTILGGVEIGEGALIGAGAVVTSDVAPGTTVIGSPARPLTSPSDDSPRVVGPAVSDETVPFADVAGQYEETREAILAAWARILDSGAFVSGIEVRRFEEAFAKIHGVRHCVAVSSGTDALTLALRALGVNRDDAVAVPANTFVATAEAVCNVNARPVLVDCDRESGLMDPIGLAAIEDPELRGAIPVHLYGLPAPMKALRSTLNDTSWLLEDAAQAHLAELDGQRAGTMGIAGCFSFYPGKNLGAPGEGGAVVTDDASLAETIRALRDHGQATRYQSRYVGWNARMTEMVAVALRLRLPLLPLWTEARRTVASWYRERLEGFADIGLQFIPQGSKSANHLFVLTLPHRDLVMEDLRAADIGVGLHYPVPIHLQEAFASLGYSIGDFPNAEWRAERLLSVPMSPTLEEWQVDRVCEQLRKSLDSRPDR